VVPTAARTITLTVPGPERSWLKAVIWFSILFWES
jgi:hypothetical protein